jgi:hypothetical protein
MREVEKNCLVKLKIMYTIGFLNSYSNVQQMTKKNPNARAHIPEDSINNVSDLFDKYFGSNPE